MYLLIIALFATLSATSAQVVLYEGPTDVETPIRVFSDWLYVGGWTAAKPENLQRYGITHVVALYHREEVSCETSQVCLNRYIDDTPTQSIRESLSAVFQFIQTARGSRQTKILIHCKQGRSRSVAHAIGYMMFAYDMHYDVALNLVLSQHSLAQPNVGFVQELTNMHN